MVTICQQSSLEEIEQIKALQTRNLKSQLTEAERQTEGFLTASYTLDFLQYMFDKHPAILAKDQDKVVGYALVATPEIRGYHELLDDLLGHCDRVVYNGVTLQDVPYAVVGQLCVAKAYRGQGIVQKLYAHFRECMVPTHSCCITDVDQNNPRSLRAHLKSGFEVVGTLDYGGSAWDLVLWNWRL